MNWLSGLKNNSMFWEGAFVVALLLLIFAHKVSIEGMVSA